MTFKLFGFYKHRDNIHRELMTQFINLPVIKECFSIEMKHLLFSLFESKRTDMAQLVKEITNLKNKDNLRIIKM